MKIIHIRQRFQHMGSHSGYDMLSSTINQIIGKNQFDTKKMDIWQRPKSFNINQIYLKKGELKLLDIDLNISLKKKLNGLIYNKSPIPPTLDILNKVKKSYRFQHTFHYHYPHSLFAEIQALFAAYQSYNSIIHFLYLENSYGLLGQKSITSKIEPCKILASTHQPSSWWKIYGNPSIFKNLDSLIVVSEKEKEYFQQYLDHEKIHFIPHGISIDFFKPDYKKRKEFRCVFSGFWLRDTKCLVNVIERILSMDNSIYFDIIHPIPKGEDYDFLRITRNDNVKMYFNLSDNELLEIYQTGSLLFIPLLDCTANNAILEGMACGMPILTSKVDGVNSYIHPSFSWQFNNFEVDNAAQKILEISKLSSNEINSISNQARKYAESNFDWLNIANRTIDLYSHLANS